jgi:hypothetical protein
MSTAAVFLDIEKAFDITAHRLATQITGIKIFDQSSKAY